MQLDWVEELKVRFVSGENVIFLLHGNVNDLFPFYDEDKDQHVFCSLTEYLCRMLKGTKDLIVDFNLSEGFQLHTSKKISPLG